MILVAFLIGLVIPSIELVIGLAGSTIGVAICIMFPAACFVKGTKKDTTEKLLAQVMSIHINDEEIWLRLASTQPGPVIYVLNFNF